MTYVGDWRLVDVGGEPHFEGALPRGEDGSGRDLLDVLEELRLGRAGVSA